MRTGWDAGDGGSLGGAGRDRHGVSTGCGSTYIAIASQAVGALPESRKAKKFFPARRRDQPLGKAEPVQRGINIFALPVFSARILPSVGCPGPWGPRSPGSLRDAPGSQGSACPAWEGWVVPLLPPAEADFPLKKNTSPKANRFCSSAGFSPKLCFSPGLSLRPGAQSEALPDGRVVEQGGKGKVRPC